MAYLRAQGYLPQIVEHWNAYGRVKQDLYGFIDIVGLKEGVPGVLGVQTTTGDHVAARVAKARELPAFRLWVLAGNRLDFHGWRKIRGERGREVWDVRVVSVVAQNGEPTVVEC